MLSFYQQILQTLSQTSVIIATVIKTQGSVPREIGAKMFIHPDGEICGTIGGGAGEAKVIRQALQIFQTRQLQVEETDKKRVVEIDLSGAPNKEIQGICGGTMEVLLELWEGSWAIELVSQVIQSMNSNNTVTLVTPLITSQKPYLITTEETVSNLEKIAFIEKLTPPPTLLIIGAGHIAVPLAKIAKITGFEIIVQDDRIEYASQLRFPDAVNILSQPIESIAEILEKHSNLYIALVTRGYLQDLDALRIILNCQSKYQPKYIGMIGSRKRINTAFKVMENEGYSSDILQNIHAPIGLEIGAIAPEEIAISICAELIKIRRIG
ncbi:MAG: XdhC family protein [Cyanobacteria bacterium P01_A01_bin.84]